MNKRSYTYDKLSSKYEGFHAPACDLTIGSLKLKSTETDISEVEVEISAEGTAGGCRITLTDQYDYKSSKWNQKLYSALKVGAKLVVKLGFVETEEVFFGYVDDYEYAFSSDGGPEVHITGLDGVGYLMGVRSRAYAGKKKIVPFVKQTLNDAVSAGAAEKVTVGAALNDMTVQRIMEGEDSYTFLNTLAKQLGVSFFCVDGELIFDDVISKSTKVTTLTYGEGLYSFSRRFSLANQPGKVIVHGRDVNNKAIKGEATKTSISGFGDTAVKAAGRLLKKAVYEEESSLATTAAECKKLAQNRFDSMAMNYVSGGGECVGLPELTPGRYVKIAGIDKMGCESYFVSRVVHTLNSDGYYTKFEVKGAKF